MEIETATGRNCLPQRDMLSATKLELERQNDNVTSSINYAQRIQKSNASSRRSHSSLFLGKAFIMFRPRDIGGGVSG